ncbi:MAG: AMP-binding protein, partial [Oxalobacteraceae bacterium]|nr:AMP-binding protein [Oxalobacteraceae bacterium]
MTDFDKGLERRDVNFTPLTPLDFIGRTAQVYGDRLAVVYGEVRRNWRETEQRCRHLASALSRLGIGKSDTVAVMLPNLPEMVEVHFGVPMSGAVLNTLNTRLDFATLHFMLLHGEAKLLIIDTEYLDLANQLKTAMPALIIVGVQDRQAAMPAVPADWLAYEMLLAEADPDFVWQMPADEWDAIALN